MATINISLPDKLKEEAEKLVKAGYYSSMSDLIRDAIRTVSKKSKYDVWADEARKDLKAGKATVLKSKKEIEDYFDSI